MYVLWFFDTIYLSYSYSRHHTHEYIYIHIYIGYTQIYTLPDSTATMAALLV